MANNNKPEKFGKSDTPVIDPNSPEGLAEMKRRASQSDTRDAYMQQFRGERPPQVGMPGSQSNLGPTYQTPLDQAKADLDAAGADAAGPTVVNPDATPEENIRVVQRRSDRRRRAERDVGERSQSFQTSPGAMDEMAGTPLRGEVWSGGATGARIVMDATGQTWSVTRDGVVSPVDERQAKAIVSWDREKSIQQELKRRTRVEEMELEAGLDALENEGAEFKVFNSVALQNRMNEHAGFRTPEELAILQDGLYGDAPLMERLMKLPPHTFGPILDQMEAILFGGGGRGALEQIAAGAEQKGSTSRTAARANASMGLDAHIDAAEADLLTASGDVDRLSRERATLMDQAANPDNIAGDQAHLLAELDRQLEAAKKRVTNATTEIGRAERRQSEITSRAGSEWRSGGKNLDQLLAIPVREKKLMAGGGVMESTLDSVARGNGYDGVDDANFRDMLSGNPEAVGQFVRECQEHARLAGWETSDDNTMPWVYAITEHVLKDINTNQARAVIDAIAKQIAPGADMPEKDLFAATDKGAELMANNVRSFLQSASALPRMTPSSKRVLESGVRPANDTQQYEDVWFDLKTEASNAGMSDDEISMLQEEFDAMQQEDVPQEVGGGLYDTLDKPAGRVYDTATVGETSKVSTAEDTLVLEEGWPSMPWNQPEYLESLSKSIRDEVGQETFTLAMNLQGDFDRDKSDEAWAKVEEAALELSKTLKGQGSGEGVRTGLKYLGLKRTGEPDSSKYAR